MKFLIKCFLLCLSSMTLACQPKESTNLNNDTIKKERVCIKVYDSKQKKEIEKCRIIDIHKKYQENSISKK